MSTAEEKRYLIMLKKMHKGEKNMRLYQIRNGKKWKSASCHVTKLDTKERIIRSYFKKYFLKENLLHADQKL